MNRTKPLQGACTQCGGLIEFPAEMIGTLAQCPRCRKQTELLLAAPPEAPSLPRKATVWTIVAIAILAVGLIVPLLGLKHVQKLAGHPASPAAPPGFDLSPISLEKRPGTSETYAVGTLTNTSNRARLSVTVEVNLLDARGQKLGILRAFRPTLDPGAKWRFEMPVVGQPQAVAAKLASLKADP